jgi:lantibiotic modifying enzyme
MEYVQLSNNSVKPQDYEAHYYKFWFLLALAHCFRVVDLHHENVFMTQDGPVLLDIETIFYPPSLDGLDATVEDTMLIGAKELSGIEGGGLLKNIGVHATRYDDHLQINYVKKSLSTNNRIVASANGCLVKPAEFKNQIFDGFVAGYDRILRDRDILFSKAREIMRLNIAGRYIARPTRYYAVKQLLCIQPKLRATHTYLRTIKDRLLTDIPKKYRPKFAALVDHEFTDLLSGDIPYFYTKSLSRHLYHRGRIAKRNCFAKSQFHALKEYFHNISEKDKHEQSEKIASALKPYSHPPHTQLIEEAEST